MLDEVQDYNDFKFCDFLLHIKTNYAFFTDYINHSMCQKHFDKLARTAF